MDKINSPNARPKVVTGACVAMGASTALSFSLLVFHAHPHGWFGRMVLPVIISSFASLPLLLIWLAFCAKNWARWSIAALMLWSLLSFQSGLKRYRARSEFEVWFYGIHTAVETVATALLFVPASNRWYRTSHAPGRQPPDPGPTRA